MSQMQLSSCVHRRWALQLQTAYPRSFFPCSQGKLSQAYQRPYTHCPFREDKSKLSTNIFNGYRCYTSNSRILPSLNKIFPLFAQSDIFIAILSLHCLYSSVSFSPKTCLTEREFLKSM